MPGSGELSVVTVVALVLGGVAAFILAVAVATKDPHRARPGLVGSAQAAPSLAPLGSAAPSASAEIEVPAELLYPVESEAPSEP